MTVDTIAIGSAEADDDGLLIRPVAGAPIAIPPGVEFEINGVPCAARDIPPWAAHRLPGGVDAIICRSGDEITTANFVAHHGARS